MTVNILIVGGADTGRAPTAAALLRRLLARRYPDWSVSSAGVLGHDGDPAEPEARDALLAVGLDIQAHRARSLDEDMAAAATLLVAVDSGTARVVRARYPAAATRTVTLGELAGRPRDIPDPFRMQIGAWIGYTREMDQLLQAGLERLVARVRGEPVSDPLPDTPLPAEPPPPAPAPQAAPVSAEQDARQAAIDRAGRLLSLMREMPTVVDWAHARRQFEAELSQIGREPLHAAEMLQPYTAMLLALLNMTPALPTGGQLAVLCTAFDRMRTGVDAPAVAALSAEATRWDSI